MNLHTKKVLSLGSLRIEVPAIVASLSGDVIKKAEMAEDMGADLVEVRLDLVTGDPLRVARDLRGVTSLPIIATNRMRQEGGQFKGGERERLALLCQASHWADLVDVELRAEGRDWLMKSAEVPYIISYHDFEGMPDPLVLESLLSDMFKSGANIAKVAVTPRNLNDALELLGFLLKTDNPICMMGMGEIGRHLRALAPLYGSVFTYGYIGEKTAPGQMSVEMLRVALDILMKISSDYGGEHVHHND